MTKANGAFDGYHLARTEFATAKKELTTLEGRVRQFEADLDELEGSINELEREKGEVRSQYLIGHADLADVSRIDGQITVLDSQREAVLEILDRAAGMLGPMRSKLTMTERKHQTQRQNAYHVVSRELVETVEMPKTLLLAFASEALSQFAPRSLGQFIDASGRFANIDLTVLQDEISKDYDL